MQIELPFYNYYVTLTQKDDHFNPDCPKNEPDMLATHTQTGLITNAKIATTFGQ
jgi:hypothetical protein